MQVVLDGTGRSRGGRGGPGAIGESGERASAGGDVGRDGVRGVEDGGGIFLLLDGIFRTSSVDRDKTTKRDVI